MELSIECPKCRGTKFIRTENPRGDEPVTCASCASSFHYSELEALAIESAQGTLARPMPTDKETG